MWLQLHLPSEIAHEALGLEAVTLDGSKAVIVAVTTSGQCDPNKTGVAVYLRRGLVQRLRRLAQARRQTITRLLESTITEQTGHAADPCSQNGAGAPAD